ncbi:sugar transferase [Listeria fleischmannii]|uniref:Sugar transferase n=1 Tax=Listeria fleischmannii TaxID=1069827 RepID=A0A841YIK1_9LIST|nr:sugar transferase [Listeria fleischmannii]MBC1399868.1 sugar transferase [Listeria fleischmannii]MBC1419454.1 sugar transferase [Listeria fleischmannii]MBC1428177.1 sugar transferase [Listeria fleischmannii]
MRQRAETLENAYSKTFKRFCDILFSMILLVFSSPFLLLTAILVKMDSPKEPVLFKQIRTGYLNQPFTIYKFRSMRSLGAAKTDNNTCYNWVGEVPDDFVFKSSNGATKLSKIGYFVRKFSLDELPQLWNVLKGDMSFIGPRPEIPEITKHYSTNQMARLLTKPGISGWAQANGRSEMNHGQKIEFDLYYVENCSLRLDLFILLLTIKCVLSGKGSV